ncbi:MAG: hypothetical protein ABSB83_04840 [Methanomassiliicoccales archaeon]|jgi:hypothetical protein
MDSQWKERFNWSISRSRQWGWCRKGLFFKCIRKYDKDLFAKKLDRLSSLQSIRFLGGKAVHNTIFEQIQQHELGRPSSLDSALVSTSSYIDDNLKFGKDLIVEIQNGMKIDKATIQDMHTHTSVCVRNFCERHAPNLVAVDYLEHEQYRDYLMDGVLVKLRPDFVSRSGSIVTATDWKTGKATSLERIPQVPVLAEYTSKHYACDLAKIRVEIVFLNPYSVLTSNCSESLIDEMHCRIRGEMDEILSCKSEDDFVANPGHHCLSCNFATVCEEGSEVIKGSPKIFSIGETADSTGDSED